MCCESDLGLPTLRTAQVAGSAVTYTLQGPAEGPAILYFHGWGDDYRIVCRLEYPLIQAGYRLLVVHRPGYAGTALDDQQRGESSRRSVQGCARIAAALVSELCGDKAVYVVGTSGGAPAALAFADLHADKTIGLILQAGVTQPWTDPKYVPAQLRNVYIAAFERGHWLGERLSRLLFVLWVAVKDSRLTDADRLQALMGSRLSEVKDDPAFERIASCILQEDKVNRPGEINDIRHVLLARSAYCRWDRIRSPTLIIHDPQDAFVPFVHAEEAARKIPHAQMRAYRLGGHIVWMGKDAQRMHADRLRFLHSTMRPLP